MAFQLVAFAGAALAIAAFVYAVRLLRRTRATEQLRCPKTGQLYDVTFARLIECRPGHETNVDVVRCSRFCDPRKIACSKSCLYRTESDSQQVSDIYDPDRWLARFSARMGERERELESGPLP